MRGHHGIIHEVKTAVIARARASARVRAAAVLMRERMQVGQINVALHSIASALPSTGKRCPQS